MKSEIMTLRRVRRVCVLLLAVLQLGTPSSAQNVTTAEPKVSTLPPASSGYRTKPANLTVPLGDPAVFRCGVAQKSPNVTFTLYGSHGNYSLTCPGGHVEDIPQALYGSCETESGESLAVWTIKGTSIPDNGTRLVCQEFQNPTTLVAVLHVFDSGLNYFILVGCTIGGFFGILLVFGLIFIALQRSESFQRCFRGKDPEDDMETVITKDEKSGKKI